jgi:hypothetical protein
MKGAVKMSVRPIPLHKEPLAGPAELKKRARAVETADSIKIVDDEIGTVFEFFWESRRGVLKMPRGDITLEAEEGAIELKAKKGVRINSEGEVQIASATEILLSTLGRKGGNSALGLAREGVFMLGRRFGLKAQTGRFEIADLSLASRRLQGEVKSIKLLAQRVESKIDRVAQTVKICFLEVEELLSVQASQWRAEVKKEFILRAGQADIKTEEDVSINGREIRLG